MSVGGMFSNQAIGGLAVRNLDLAVLAQLLARQSVAKVGAPNGGAAGSHGDPGVDRAAQPAPPPPQGAPESGKGTLVDVSV